jgi:KipI family sensor histidine kinase inhibitor
MRFLPAGYSGLLVECDDLAQVVALHRALERSRPKGVVDLVPAALTLLLTFDSSTTHARLSDTIAATDLDGDKGPAQERHVTIEVTYDGADLADVAELTGRSVEALVEALTTAELTVAFGGFAPGFGYLSGLPEELHVPRRATPRTRVPAGSVALAGPFAGVYPPASPGGWQLVGRTDAVLFDVDRDPPALLVPGTAVRFRDVG